MLGLHKEVLLTKL